MSERKLIGYYKPRGRAYGLMRSVMAKIVLPTALVMMSLWPRTARNSTRTGDDATCPFNAESRAQPQVVRIRMRDIPPPLLPVYQYMVGQVSVATFDLDTSPVWPTYVNDCMALFRRLPQKYQNRTFLLRLGDSPDRAYYPVMAKSRVIGDANTTLLPLNYDRHFGEAYQSVLRGRYDYMFQDKIAKVFWRGSTTDAGWDPSRAFPNNQRRLLVEAWGDSADPRVDVGISAFVQELHDDQHLWRHHWSAYYKPFVPIPDQLMCRYLVAVEGNDVSSALKWMLASNSVVMMPEPRRESWILESQLQAWIHYVPLRPDFSDLLDRVSFCERNLKVCIRISRAATEYMRDFSNRSMVFDKGAENLRTYLENISEMRVEDQSDWRSRRYEAQIENARSHK